MQSHKNHMIKTVLKITSKTLFIEKDTVFQGRKTEDKAKLLNVGV
jgi:hypothetical protein